MNSSELNTNRTWRKKQESIQLHNSKKLDLTQTVPVQPCHSKFFQQKLWTNTVPQILHSQLQKLCSTIVHIEAHRQYQFMDRLPNPPKSIENQKSCCNPNRDIQAFIFRPNTEKKNPWKHYHNTWTPRGVTFTLTLPCLTTHNHKTKSLAFFLTSYSLPSVMSRLNLKS